MPNFPVEKKQPNSSATHGSTPILTLSVFHAPNRRRRGRGEEVPRGKRLKKLLPFFFSFFFLFRVVLLPPYTTDDLLPPPVLGMSVERERQMSKKKTRHHPLPCELRESGSLFFEFHQRPKDVPPPLLFFLQVGTSSPPLLFLFSRASFSILEFQRPLLPSHSFKIDHFRLTPLEPLAKLFFPAPPKTISQYTPSAINRDFWEIPNRRITAPPPPLLRTCVALSHSHTTAAEAAAMEPPNQAKGTGSPPPPPPFSAGFVAYSATPSLRLPAPTCVC